MIIIHSPERAAQNLLEEIINVQDLPLYLVENYMADTSDDDDPELDPEFTHDDIINVLRHVLNSGLIFFAPGHRMIIDKNIPILAESGRFQEDIWHGDNERILIGIRNQLENWEWKDLGYFIPKQKAEAQNDMYQKKFGYDEFIFIEPNDEELRQPLKIKG
jgi:hypothetical protein